MSRANNVATTPSQCGDSSVGSSVDTGFFLHPVGFVHEAKYDDGQV